MQHVPRESVKEAIGIIGIEPRSECRTILIINKEMCQTLTRVTHDANIINAYNGRGLCTSDVMLMTKIMITYLNIENHRYNLSKRDRYLILYDYLPVSLFDELSRTNV